MVTVDFADVGLFAVALSVLFCINTFALITMLSTKERATFAEAVGGFCLLFNVPALLVMLVVSIKLLTE